MARPARGADNLEWAREVLALAQTVEQLRQAQAVVLPLDYGLSLEQTARAIGRSVPWTCRLRNRFLAGEIVGDGQRESRGGRRRKNMSADQEREVLGPVPGSSQHARHPGGGSGQGRTGGRLGAAHGAVLGLQPAAPPRLAQAGPGQAPPAKRSAGPRGLEKKLPDRLAQFRALWPEQAPIKLMFQDEARFGRINDVRRCWAPKPVRPLCQAMLTHEYTYAYAVVDVQTGELDSLMLPPPHNIRLLSLPPYAPELDPVEHVWDELREKRFHNRVFDSLDALEDHLEIALKDFELDAPTIKSIVAWPWIIDAPLN